MTFTFTIDNIQETAREFWEENRSHKVWAFQGEMGAGKTTFIHALCEVLGVTSAVGSPTYAIINEYTSAMAGTIFHMDWYRLKDEEEAVMAGVEDALYSNSLCFVEWPGKAPALLPGNTLHINLEIINFTTRRITTFLP